MFAVKPLVFLSILLGMLACRQNIPWPKQARAAREAAPRIVQKLYGGSGAVRVQTLHATYHPTTDTYALRLRLQWQAPREESRFWAEGNLLLDRSGRPLTWQEHATSLNLARTDTRSGQPDTKRSLTFR